MVSMESREPVEGILKYLSSTPSAMEKLREMEISYSFVSSEGAERLRDCLLASSSLQWLNFYGSRTIGQFPQIFQALPDTLSELLIGECNMCREAVVVLSKYLQTSKSLKTLYARGNPEIG